MDEQTSFSTEESLFSDVTAEDIAEMSSAPEEDVKPNISEEEQKEVNEEVPAQEQEQSEAKPSEESFSLTHLGKEVKLSREELIRAAQKGLDYDRVRGSYDKVNAMAQSAGQSVEQFLSGIEQQAGEIKIAQRVRELVNTGEYSENSARKMAEMELKLNSQQKLQEQAQAKQSQAEQARKSVGEFIMKNPEFMKEFPDAKMPAEMVQALNNGASINEAWTSYQLNKQAKAMQEMQAELDRYKQLEKNKQAAAPKLQAEAGSGEKDPFLEGLLGE